MSVKEQIAQILNDRKGLAEDVKKSVERWGILKGRTEKLELVINELERVCTKTDTDDPNLLKLKKYLTFPDFRV